MIVFNGSRACKARLAAGYGCRAVGMVMALALIASAAMAATDYSSASSSTDSSSANPVWEGQSVTGCTAANPAAYLDDTTNGLPGGATYMKGIITVHPGKKTYGTIEAWADGYPQITYVCQFLDNKQPFPDDAHDRVWVNWDTKATYSKYTIAPVTFSPYYDPAGSGSFPTGGGGITECNGHLNQAQLNQIYSRACFTESYNNQQNGWTSWHPWDGSCQIFFGLYQNNTAGQRCYNVFGTTSPLVCADGNWTAADNCNGT